MYAGRYTSTISVIQIPSFQCSLWRDTSSQSPKGSVAGTVAGITKLPAAEVTKRLLRRHFGRFTVKKVFCVEVLTELELPVFDELDTPDVTLEDVCEPAVLLLETPLLVDWDIFVEVLFVDETERLFPVEVVVPLDVEVPLELVIELELLCVVELFVPVEVAKLVPREVVDVFESPRVVDLPLELFLDVELLVDLLVPFEVVLLVPFWVPLDVEVPVWLLVDVLLESPAEYRQVLSPPPTVGAPESLLFV